ncbi:hypothetical protein [Fructobacillus parabroussonetiae]|uniref:Uncharacterized protein n=1 Tax=Fructobacillus parabroussonetiae TaxID=2713174 RepID=A0ABS5QXE3_9LACO|nr:hypothetical protein [Fructobacillus parabroussonetiae]MBS9337869.1 hypothetical protein [Fructobacillus parabroussonetiae]MCK8617602.1 hypothetical protein [Fructobacillus parabroussonetiae]
MQNKLLPTLIGTVVYFLVIHFLFSSNSLRMDLFSAALFFLIFTGVNWLLQRGKKRNEDK